MTLCVNEKLNWSALGGNYRGMVRLTDLSNKMISLVLFHFVPFSRVDNNAGSSESVL